MNRDTIALGDVEITVQRRYSRPEDMAITVETATAKLTRLSAHESETKVELLIRSLTPAKKLTA